METTSALSNQLSSIRSTPYSLGKLIEWKLASLYIQSTSRTLIATPYSLGKLIEWKLAQGEPSPFIPSQLPTR
jgi:hypothetical protein